MTLAAVWMVSRAVDQVAQEAQSEARQANGLRVSWKLRDSQEVIRESFLGRLGVCRVHRICRVSD